MFCSALVLPLTWGYDLAKAEWLLVIWKAAAHAWFNESGARERRGYAFPLKLWANAARS
jgi:hypothetical protein